MDELDEVVVTCDLCLTRPMCKSQAHNFTKKLMGINWVELDNFALKAKFVHMTYFTVIYEKCPYSLPYVYKVKSGKHIVKQYIKILKLMKEQFNLTTGENSTEDMVSRINRYVKENKHRDLRKFSLKQVCLQYNSFLNYEKDKWFW